MHIQACHLKNYRSFRDSGHIQFAPGINLVVGPNNVGKTALLTALELQQFSSTPHRDPYVAPGVVTNPNSWMSIEIVAGGTELRNRVLAANGQFQIPVPEAVTDPDAAVRYIDGIFAREQLVFSIQWNNGWQPARQTSFEPAPPEGYVRTATFRTRLDRSRLEFAQLQALEQAQPPDTLYGLALSSFITSSYRFRAERVIRARCPISNPQVLSPDGSNLGATLLYLQANRRLYDELMSYVRAIFQNVQYVSVIPIPASECEIRVWTFDPGTGREELTVSLDESGTGLSQVLAILYVVVTSREPKTIMIDEPNSYLHPGAERNLIEILRSTPHQYIITTHSPEIISVSDPSTINLLSWEQAASVVSPVASGDIADARRILMAVGSKLSDVYGSDSALWVEGPTEAECFRRILTHFGKLPLGTTILPVRNTGDFEAKRAPIEMVWEIYEKLTANNALLPTAIAFSFDREGRSDTAIADMLRRAGGRVRFLPKRMFENYLLHPDALAVVLNRLEAFTGNPLTAERVETWLMEKALLKEYGGPGTDSVGVPDLGRVDAARLLKDLVTELSETKHQYDKIAHGIDLTAWICANHPERFEELLQYLIEAVTAPETAAA